RKSDDRPVAELDSAPVDERRALHDCRVLHRTAMGEPSHPNELQSEHVAWGNDDRPHTVFLVRIRQTVDPGVHVPAVELREAESGCEDVVERVPIFDLPDGNLHDWHQLIVVAARSAFANTGAAQRPTNSMPYRCEISIV